MAVTAGDAAHSRHGGQRGRGRWGRREVDNPLAVRPRASDPLAAALADEETVAGAADVPREGGDKMRTASVQHILSARRSVSDGGGLVAGVALHHVLHHHHFNTVQLKNNSNQARHKTNNPLRTDLVLLAGDVDHV